MAITVHNQKIEQDIREIARQTGEEPNAVIARIVEAEARRLGLENGARAARERLPPAERLARMRAFRATLPKFTDEEKKAVWEALDDLYDEDGLPK